MSDAFDPYHVWLGIPPEEQPPNHYRLLGLRPFEDNLDVISNALDQRRAFLRTFQAGKRSALSQRLLNEVSAAGICLLDAAKKTAYDGELQARLPIPPSNDFAEAALPLPAADLRLPQAAAPQPLVLAKSPARPVRTLRGKKSSSSSALAAGIVIASALAVLAVAGAVGWYAFVRPAPPSVAGAAAVEGNQTATKHGESAAPAVPTLPSSSASAGKASPVVSPLRTKSRPAEPATPAKVEGPQVVPLDSSGSIPRPTTQESPAPREPANPLTTASGGVRIPVPNKESLASALEGARTIYESELKAAAKAGQKAALARRILDAGKQTASDPTARYALLDLARKVFAQAGDVSESLATARLLESEFDVARDKLVGETVEALEGAALPPEQRTELTKLAADLADAALDADEFDRADRLSAVAVQLAGKVREADFKRQIGQRRSQVLSVLKEWNALKPSLEKLKHDPSDATANLAAGKFYCFTLDDFARGLAHLAAGSDPLLAQAARLDQAAHPRGTAKDRLAAATAWQQAEAKLADKDDKHAAQRRERWLLLQVGSGLDSNDTVRVSKRLEELKELDKPRSTSRSAARPNIALIGRVLVAGSGKSATDAGIVVSYEHGYALTNDDFARLKKAANVGQMPLNVQLVGGFVLPSDQNITIRLAGQAAAGGTFRVVVDNHPPLIVGAGRPPDSSQSLALKAGPHLVAWEWSGTDFTTAFLEIRGESPVGDDAPPLVAVGIDRSIESTARRPPVRTSLHFGPPR